MFGFVYYLLHEAPLFNDENVVISILEHCRDLVADAMAASNQKRPSIREIRWEIMYRVGVQNFIGDFEIFLVLNLYPEYFFRVDSGHADSEARYSAGKRDVGRREFGPHMTTMSARNVLEWVGQRGTTLEAYFRDAFDIENAAQADKLLSKLTAELAAHLKCYRDDLDGLRHVYAISIFEATETRSARLKAAGYSGNMTTGQNGSLIGWGLLVRMLLKCGEMALWFEDPLRLDFGPKSKPRFCRSDRPFALFIPKQDTFPFTKWHGGANFCSEMRRLPDNTLLYAGSYVQPQMKQLLKVRVGNWCGII